jgi:DNA-binding HxlR family transcriptional regulator
VTAKRHYGQFCGLAAGLDVIGERWTLLIVRELLIGPARFSEILDNLPGIGANLLSERLRTLTEYGVVEHSPVVGDGRGKQYRLTEIGDQLREPLLGLARWGLRFTSPEVAISGASRAAWGFLAVQAMIHGREAEPVTESYEFRVDDEVFRIDVVDGQSGTARGHASDPAMVVTTDALTFIRIGSSVLTPFQAVASGQMKIHGSPDAIERCTRLMGLAG